MICKTYGTPIRQESGKWIHYRNYQDAHQAMPRIDDIPHCRQSQSAISAGGCAFNLDDGQIIIHPHHCLKMIYVQVYRSNATRNKDGFYMPLHDYQSFIDALESRSNWGHGESSFHDHRYKIKFSPMPNDKYLVCFSENLVHVWSTIVVVNNDTINKIVANLKENIDIHEKIERGEINWHILRRQQLEASPYYQEMLAEMRQKSQ